VAVATGRRIRAGALLRSRPSWWPARNAICPRCPGSWPR
jgi:hypothetical protein